MIRTKFILLSENKRCMTSNVYVVCALAICSQPILSFTLNKIQSAKKMWVHSKCIFLRYCDIGLFSVSPSIIITLNLFHFTFGITCDVK